MAGQESIGHLTLQSFISLEQMSHWLAIRDFRLDLTVFIGFLPVLPLLRSASVTKLLSESKTFDYTFKFPRIFVVLRFSYRCAR